MTERNAIQPIDFTRCSKSGSLSAAELLELCRSDLEGLSLTEDEATNLIGAIQCIVESVLDTKYGLRDRPSEHHTPG
ncbi:MAG: hypothetical protein QM783_15960 [Phycisphaerales bacterium]